MTDSSATSCRICVDLLPRLLEAPLAVGLGLVFRPLGLRVGDLACLREDARCLVAGLADQRLVLLEQRARLGTGGVSLFDRLADAVAALVDRLLDRAEREPLQDEERQPERDERPDHQAGDDLDQTR